MSIAPLPVTITPHPGESIESWLEHLAAANELSTATLIRLIRDSNPLTTRYLTLAPSTRAATNIASLARVTEDVVRSTSAAGFADTAVDFTGLDHTDPHSHRVVAARGWAPTRGTQICPTCLAEDTAWMAAWRLPIITSCTRHESFLVVMCPGCERPFRDRHHTHLRPAGDPVMCANPTGSGPKRQCRHDLTDTPTITAGPDILAMQNRVDHALKGGHVDVLGIPATGQDYLTDLRHLSTLLLHLSGHSGTEDLADWTKALQAATKTRKRQRRPRWGLRPPEDPALRGHALSTANNILTSRDLDVAANRLLPWVDKTPDTAAGPLGWLSDRTVMTPTLQTLVMTTLAPRARISHYLDHNPQKIKTVDTCLIPQLIPADLYTAHLAGVTNSSETTTRLYASLCLARLHPAINTWAGAARALDMPGRLGAETARACSAELGVNSDEWSRRLESVSKGLRNDHGPRWNYRHLENKIRHRATLNRWFETWRRRYRPTTHTDSKGHAITWQWIHIAHAHPNFTPAQHSRPLSASRRSAYRQFESSLDLAQQNALEYVVHVGSSLTRMDSAALKTANG